MASHKHNASLSSVPQLDLLSLPEIWKFIPGFAGFYEVSNQGNVRSVSRQYMSVGRKVTVPGRFLRLHHESKKRPTKNYRYVNLSFYGKIHRRSVHRLVLEAFVGLRPEGYVCNHIDGNQANNVLENLEWVTWQRNAEDSVERGTKRVRRGETSNFARFTAQDIIIIRRLATEALTYGQIARLFDTDTRNISRIVRRINWKHVP